MANKNFNNIRLLISQIFNYFSERTRENLVHPVLAAGVVEEPVEGGGREHEDEVFGRLDVFQQMRVELARVEAVHVDEHFVAAELEQHLDQAGQL